MAQVVNLSGQQIDVYWINSASFFTDEDLTLMSQLEPDNEAQVNIIDIYPIKLLFAFTILSIQYQSFQDHRFAIRLSDNSEVEGVFTKNGQDETVSVYLDDEGKYFQLKSSGDVQSQTIYNDISDASRQCAKSSKGDQYAKCLAKVFI